MIENNVIPPTDPLPEPELRQSKVDPKGVLQKHLKSLVYLGAALLVIVAALFSSTNKKTPAQQQAVKGQPPQPTLQDNTDNNVQDLKNQLKAEHDKEQQQAAANATTAGEPSTPERCCGAEGSMSDASSVPLTRRSISSGCDIQCTNCCGDGRSSSKCAKIFCGLSMKNSPFRSLVGWKREAATVRASARRTSSSDGPQYGQRRSSGLRTMSPRLSS